MYVEPHETYLVTLRNGVKVEGQFTKLTESTLVEDLQPSAYLEFSTLDMVYQLSRKDFINIEEIDELEEVDYEPDIAEAQQPVYVRKDVRIYSSLLHDIIQRAGALDLLDYTLYGMLGAQVEAPLHLQIREARRTRHKYYEMRIGAFSRGLLVGKTKMIPTTGTVLVAVEDKFVNKRQPVQVSGYLEELPDTYGPTGYVLLKLAQGVIAPAYAAVYTPTVLTGDKKTRQQLQQLIVRPELYSLATVQPEILYQRYKVTYGYDRAGNTCKRMVRRPRMIHMPSTLATVRNLIPDSDAYELENVFAHCLFAIDANGLTDEFAVYGEILTAFGVAERKRIEPGIDTYKLGSRDVTIYNGAFVAQPFAELYASAYKQASKTNTFIFLGFAVYEGVPLPHIRIQDMQALR